VLGRVAAGRLRELYGGAIALVLPSWLEGFGLTPVEALAHGTPAIVSDLPVLREVLGEGGALYVPPGDVERLAGALLTLAGDGELRARLAAAGRAATARLSWAETARRMRAILAEAAA
jgi:glycosyltransferase involved in cell wall biosynthesis